MFDSNEFELFSLQYCKYKFQFAMMLALLMDKLML